MPARTPIQTDKAPKAIGPYSQAIKSNGLLFCSGQVPIDPATGKLIDGDVVAQTHRVMANLSAVLAAGQSGFDRVLKTTIFLADMADFTHVNGAYATYFEGVPPARATVQVAGLPLGARVEIEAIAVVD